MNKPIPARTEGGLRLTVPAVIALALLAATVISGCRTAPEPEAAPVVVEVDLPPDPGWPMLTADTAIEVELPEPFIRMVDFARLRIGMTKEEVLAVFPDPYQIELRRSDELWQYGFAELIFRGNLLADWFDVR